MKAASKYKLNLVGQGMNLKREISNAVARTIVDLVLRSEGLDHTPTDVRAASVGATGVEIQGNEDLSPKQFMVQKNPKTDMQRIACLGYYLTHSRKTPHFKTKDLNLLNREAAQPQLSNPAAAVRNAAANKYLSPAGSGQKQITSVGEAIVKALPDFDKVKEEIDKHKPRKKYQRRKNKK